MSFTSKSPANTYKDITYVDNSNSGVSSTLNAIKTGNGSETSLSLSDRSLKVKSSTNNTVALDVQNASGDSKFSVDTSNGKVLALGHVVNTQIATFSVGAETQSSAFADDTHQAIPFSQ